MGLRYPFVLILIVASLVAYFIFTKKKKAKYKTGKKIANTYFAKSTAYYKNKVRKYKLIRSILLSLFIVSFLTSAILMSRPFSIETKNIEERNRDIFLCMDVSSSVDELNVELVQNLKDTVDRLNGERFGISIFNTSSVVLVPLTDDYDYIKGILDNIEVAIKAGNPATYGMYSGDDYLYIRRYILSGTLEENLTRGSSIIGDGLASCVYSFSNPEEERTRLVIFSTDNDLAGTPLISLSQAGSIAKKKNVKVFGIGTKFMKSEDRAEFKKAVEKTGGKFYEHSADTVNNIVNDIEKTSKSLLKNQTETREFDVPLIFFTILFISTLGIIFIGRKVAK